MVEDMLRAWAARADDTTGNDEDIIMSDPLSPEVQLEELKRCMEAFALRMQGNEWVTSILAASSV